MELIKVDRFDCVAGTIEKQAAHQKGVLHRALSVCLFDSKDRWLLQKRSSQKYHSAHLIANSCCSHPLPGEKTLEAAERRVQEELGLVCKLHFCSSFVYKAQVGNGLIEHEYDHLFVGFSDEIPHPNPEEIESVFFMSEREIEEKIASQPHIFAAWFPFVFREIVLHKATLTRLRTSPNKII